MTGFLLGFVFLSFSKLILDQALVRPGRFDRQIQVPWLSKGLWGEGFLVGGFCGFSLFQSIFPFGRFGGESLKKNNGVFGWPLSVEVDPPDVQGRVEILKVHAKDSAFATVRWGMGRGFGSLVEWQLSRLFWEKTLELEEETGGAHLGRPSNSRNKNLENNMT